MINNYSRIGWLLIAKDIKHREIEYPFSRDLHFFYISIEHIQKSLVCLVTKKFF